VRGTVRRWDPKDPRILLKRPRKPRERRKKVMSVARQIQTASLARVRVNAYGAMVMANAPHATARGNPLEIHARHAVVQGIVQYVREQVNVAGAISDTEDLP
jgi:hypothetical protein